jgi:hypothetical protein
MVLALASSPARISMMRPAASRLLPRMGLIAAPDAVAAVPARRSMARAVQGDKSAEQGHEQQQPAAVQPHQRGAPVQRRRRDPLSGLPFDELPTSLMPFGRWGAHRPVQSWQLPCIHACMHHPRSCPLLDPCLQDEQLHARHAARDGHNAGCLW